ncbi:pyruvate/2-oxoglutarate dehydrogenase complex dihydrolipoamide acyltransferase (E2) component [Duganella sp. 1224]|uniref:hypothetical protein n=1 Tax=Duganella sp. 1224 TaxID=2587052 RepID=UPI0015CA5713|nr:hypothetical protein [Duganella sp. 1224]NYE59790.1 pyruvate/2-oxoglutarate dehydrogenase complex dihydrolipoamide acyltransferase (E2) component [Duganella sp. 1224]
MQREEDRRPSSGRPSLLSQAPQAESGRTSVFDGLERRPAGGASAAPAAKRARKPVLLAAAVGIVVLAAGIGIWLAAEPEPVLTVAAAPAAAPAPAAPSAAASAPAAPAATIVEDTAAVSAPADARSLKEVLNDIPPKAPHAELTAALEKPHKPEHKKTEKAAQKPAQVAKKTEAKPKPKAQPDNDVTLLAALMTHVQSAKTPSKEPSTPAYQLKQCGRMNEAGAAQCRAHLCATTASKEPECKQPAAVKTAAES